MEGDSLQRDFDFIKTHKPMNREAADTLRPGIHDEFFDNNKDMYLSTIPLKSIPFRGPKKFNLTGLRKGRIVVVGLFKVRRRGGNSKWVVKCSCGNYFVMRRKHIMKKDGLTTCPQCERNRFLRENR